MINLCNTLFCLDLFLPYLLRQGGGGEIHAKLLAVGKDTEDKCRRCSGILRNGLERGMEMRKMRRGLWAAWRDL